MHDDATGLLALVQEGLQSRHPSVAWLSPHVIDLEATGRIDPHVDSVRFSGHYVCGLSLLSPAVLRLQPDVGERNDGLIPSPGTGSYSDATAMKKVSNSSDFFVDVLLPPGSLYVLQGDGRYRYTHAIREDSAIFAPGTPQSITVQRERRISIIFRDEKEDG